MGWTSGLGIAELIRAVTEESDEVFPCSVVADGVYGLSGVSIGLPVRIGKGGIREIVEIPLDKEEREALSAAAEKIRGGICLK
jgi:malate dehydrogenase